MSNHSDAADSDRIVVGVDGSEPSKHALRWGQSLARMTGTYVEAIAAWELFTGWGAFSAGWAAMPADWNPGDDAEKALAATVDDVFGGQRPPGLRTEVREGNAARVLLEASKGARMLVVGSRGHGGFAGLLLGAVSAACAEHADCPVLVVHGTTPPPALASGA